MILKDRRNREYSPIYEYESDWIPSISNVDKFRFSLRNKKLGYSLSFSSDQDFNTAEKKLYKKYQTYLSCEHDWKRWIPNANTGICTKCSIHKEDMYESLEECSHNKCNKRANNNTDNGYFCADHYFEYVIARKNNIIKNSKNFEDANEKFYDILFGEILEKMIEESLLFNDLNDIEKEKISSMIMWNMNWLIQRLIGESLTKEEQNGLTLSNIWEFESNLPHSKLKIVANKYFEYSYKEEAKRPTELEKEMYELTETNVDLSFFKELLLKIKNKNIS